MSGMHGGGLGIDGLFLEAEDAPLRVRLDDAETAGGFGAIHLDGGDGDVGVGVHVLLEHLAVVHLVDVVAGKNDGVGGALAADGIDVLIDGVGGAQVPIGRNAHLRREHFDEFAESHQGGPAFAHVAVEAEGLVLGEDEDAAQVAVDAIGQRDVDDAVDAAEGHGGLGAVARERPQALALAAGQQDTDGIAHQGHGPDILTATASRAKCAWRTAVTQFETTLLGRTADPFR